MKLLFALVVFVASQCITGVASHQLPNTFPLCKQNDPNIDECLKKAIQTSLPLLKEGIPELGMASLDPLYSPDLAIKQGAGPISINMKFTNTIVTGFGDSQINKISTDLKNYNLTCEGWINQVEFESDYEMSGRILLLPVTGKGHCKIIFKNNRATLVLNGKGKTKKGKNYFDIMEFRMNVDSIDKLTVHFENLFNGDKTLGDSMNILLNENWKDLWAELKPAFEEALSAIFLHYSQSIFDKVPFNEIFLE